MIRRWLETWLLRQSEQLLSYCGNPYVAVQDDYPVGGCFALNRGYDARAHGGQRVDRGIYKITRIAEYATAGFAVYGVLVFRQDVADCAMLRIAQDINAQRKCVHEWHSGGKVA